MTEKKERFKLFPNPQGQVDIVDYVESEEKNAICIYNDLGVLPYTSAPSLCDLLNQLNDENEQLKQREETLLCEIEDFQKLLAKNDNVCHKRVIDSIDDKISNFVNVKTELLLNSDDDYRLEKLSFAIQNLRELKDEILKELEE